jgi:hypothetical protein
LNRHEDAIKKSGFGMTVRGRLLSTGLLLVGIMTVNALSAAAAPSYRPARLGGDWRFTLSLQSAKSHWDATIKQDSRGRLKGTAEPGEVDCKAGISGSVKAASVKMTWSVKPSCSSEIITLKGKYSRHHLSGTLTDSRLGSGTFAGTQDQ